MTSKNAPILFVAALAVYFGFLALATPLFAANKAKVLHSFGSGANDGTYSNASLIFDGAGNLYGTTSQGGDSGTGCGGYGCGSVFQLTRGSSDTWSETVLYSFHTDRKDGASPYASLIFDAAGNLYGTTLSGGAHFSYGTVFQLTPAGNGKWKEKVLHSFDSNGKDGYNPYASLILDAVGNLYGMTFDGGAYGSNCNDACGTVFELTPGANGKWTEKILHSFSENGKSGFGPLAGLIFDAAGNLYGMTYGGGAYGPGSVFQLRPGTNGKWKERVLHSFNFGKSGCIPYGGLILDAAGDLFGTTVDGGSGRGTVFRLTPGANGKWKEKVLHNFNGNDGGLPDSSLILDAAGNLYGTTPAGGANGGGTVFEVTP